jgi:hypothetical protein
MGHPAFQSWTPETFERTGSKPQDVIREVELDALVEKYSRDWLVMLFFPVGAREIFEGHIRALMDHYHQPYDAIMGMPVSRRRRLIEKLRESLKS